MEQKCQGENCNSTDGRNHSVECLFEHFMAYTSAHKETPDVQAKLKKAYFDGHEAGAGEWIKVEDQLPDECKLVTVYVDRYGYYPNYFSQSSRQDGAWTKEQGTWQRISHWRPLPAPPSNTN